MGVCNCSMFCCTLLYVHSSIAIILMGKRELIALLNLSSWCLVMVKRLFLAMPRGCLQFVIVVFPGILEIRAKYTGVLHKQFLDIKLPEHIVQSVQYQEDFFVRSHENDQSHDCHNSHEFLKWGNLTFIWSVCMHIYTKYGYGRIYCAYWPAYLLYACI